MRQGNLGLLIALLVFLPFETIAKVTLGASFLVFLTTPSAEARVWCVLACVVVFVLNRARGWALARQEELGEGGGEGAGEGRAQRPAGEARKQD